MVSRASAEADALLVLREKQRLEGRNDAARQAYAEARTLYQNLENRLGEANVLLGLGHLECTLGRNDGTR